MTASGASGDGFTTTALPVASAGATLSIVRMTGAFHGVIAATTPNGLCWMQQAAGVVVDLVSATTSGARSSV